MASASTTTGGMSTRQKRVLPSRSGRGGPGLGSCETDLMILETQKRKAEHEPLIPAETPFLLTTNSSLVLNLPGPSDLSLNVHANQRYFDRPEVLKAYREQQIIQTPEFENASEAPSVGGRFRPRGQEDVSTSTTFPSANSVRPKRILFPTPPVVVVPSSLPPALALPLPLPPTASIPSLLFSSKQETGDTSDAAYEKRHRKYESFEKRQRLREKEKLKHEQYKLKERIEQLRGMDGSAFLGLPAASFSAPPVVAGSGGEGLGHGSEEKAGGGERVIYVNGTTTTTAVAYGPNEGERRRKEMLDIALGLEDRYRVLLPTEKLRKTLEQEYSVMMPYEATSYVRGGKGRQEDGEEEREEDKEDEEEVVEVKQTMEKLKLRIKFPPKPSSSSLHSTISTIKPSPEPKKKRSTRRRTRSIVEDEEGEEDQLLQDGDRSESESRTTDISIPEIIGEHHHLSSSEPPSKRSRINSVSVSVSPAPALTPQLQPLLPTLFAKKPKLVRDTSMPPIESISSHMIRRPRNSSARPITIHPPKPPPPPPPFHASTPGSVTSSNSAAPHLQQQQHQRERHGRLLAVAVRTSTSKASNARQTTRTSLAFGFPVPQEVEMKKDYELPFSLRFLREPGEEGDGDGGSESEIEHGEEGGESSAGVVMMKVEGRDELEDGGRYRERSGEMNNGDDATTSLEAPDSLGDVP